jgi:hypothetical protein
MTQSINRTSLPCGFQQSLVSKCQHGQASDLQDGEHEVQVLLSPLPSCRIHNSWHLDLQGHSQAGLCSNLTSLPRGQKPVQLMPEMAHPQTRPASRSEERSGCTIRTGHGSRGPATFPRGFPGLGKSLMNSALVGAHRVRDTSGGAATRAQGRSALHLCPAPPPRPPRCPPPAAGPRP